MPRFVTTFLEHGELGVALFFTLSGFILFYTYQDNLKTSRDTYKFFVARFARLYPVYLLAIALGAAYNGRLPRSHELVIYPLLQAWVPPITDLGYTWIIQAWTLSVEAFFYCCFPLLLLAFRRKWPTSALWLLAAFFFVLNVALQTPFFHPNVPATLLTSHVILPVLCLPEFIFGMLLGAIFLQKSAFDASPATNDWITFAGIVPSLGLIAAGVGGYLTTFAAFFCFGWSIYRLASGRGWLTNLLSSRVMLLLGGASYTIYILQGLNRAWARRLLRPGLDAIVAPIVLVGLSCLIFLFYEEPIRDLVRNLLIRKKVSYRVAA
jgi:peptidoglycan/LPS O-acetylase OafA/YrhL